MTKTAAALLERLYEYGHVPTKDEIAKALGFEPSPFDTKRTYQFAPRGGSWYVALDVYKDKGSPNLIFSTGSGAVATLNRDLIERLRDDLDDHLRAKGSA